MLHGSRHTYWDQANQQAVFFAPADDTKLFLTTCVLQRRIRHRNNSEVNSTRVRRQTSHVCAPGVSISVCWTPLDASHARNFRFTSIKPSSVPQAIHSNRTC